VTCGVLVKLLLVALETLANFGGTLGLGASFGSTLCANAKHLSSEIPEPLTNWSYLSADACMVVVDAVVHSVLRV
jgi:hypothetical protein